VYNKRQETFPFGEMRREGEKVPNRIKQRRDELGLTQKELAERVKISTNYMYLIENEKKDINVSLAIRIARALNSTVEEIFSEN